MNRSAGAPAWILIAVGVLNVLYSGAYALWTLLPIVMYAVASIGTIADGTQPVGDAILGFFLLTGVPLVQLAGFFVTFLMGCVTVLGGLRLNQWRSKGIVWLGVLCAIGAPALAMVVNAGSVLNFGALGMGCITGCLLGNIPTLFTLLLGLIAGIAGAVTVSSSGERFAEVAAGY
jgi:hypothetical protein